MTYREFVSGPAAQTALLGPQPRRLVADRRRRSQRRPPRAGRAGGRRPVDLLITQNVDGLHEAAGSRALALHGRIADVVCLGCRSDVVAARAAGADGDAQPRVRRAHADALSRPDGDVDLDDTAGFVVPDVRGLRRVAQAGRGVLRRERARRRASQRSYDAVDGLADRDGALLVVGSSLTVMSGLRFVKRAARPASPVVIVNRGRPAATSWRRTRLDAGCSEFLTTLESTQPDRIPISAP